MKRLPSYGFLLFIMLVMGCFFLYPIYNTVREAFTKPGIAGRMSSRPEI